MRVLWPLVAVLLAGLAFAQAPPNLTIVPPRLEFPAQPVDAPSKPVRLTISNPGGTAVRVHQILSSGIDFSATNNCGNEIAAGSECSVQVIFKPAVSGERLGSLQIVASDAGSLHVVPLTGTGANQ